MQSSGWDNNSPARSQVCRCTPRVQGQVCPHSWAPARSLHQLKWFPGPHVFNSGRGASVSPSLQRPQGWKPVHSEEPTWRSVHPQSPTCPRSPVLPAHLSYSSFLPALHTSGLSPNIQKQQPSITCLTSCCNWMRSNPDTKSHILYHSHGPIPWSNHDWYQIWYQN